MTTLATPLASGKPVPAGSTFRLKLGVVSLVTPSVWLLPRSESAVMVGAVGVPGLTMSMTTSSAGLAALSAPVLVT